jgi:hypothetical protein
MVFLVETRVSTGRWEPICDELGRPIDLLEGSRRGDLPFRNVDEACRHFGRVYRIFAGMEPAQPKERTIEHEPSRRPPDGDSYGFHRHHGADQPEQPCQGCTRAQLEPQICGWRTGRADHRETAACGRTCAQGHWTELAHGA